MGFWRSACAALVVPLLLAAPGCAEEPEGGDARGDASVAAAHRVVSVRLVVSGGIAGTHEAYAVRRDDEGMGSARVTRILALAGDPAVRGFASEQVRRSLRCCDMRVFEIAIRYADGTQTHISTPETRPGPPELRRLVTLLSAAGS
jgi:hypothetical protein